MFNLTIAAETDLPTLTNLLGTLFEQEVDFDADQTKQKQGLKQIFIHKNHGDILIAKKEGQILGMVTLLYTISTALGGNVAILDDLIVDEEFRDQGVGSSLIEFAMKHCQEQGCKRITLMTDLDNTGAQRFYERHGFTKSRMVAFKKHF